MSQSNATLTVLSPTSRFPPYGFHSNSPSPSRSPERRQRFANVELDPLLGNLSPSSTLQALTDSNAVSIEQADRNSPLSSSIASASTSERALGIRAALAGKKIREWYHEVRGWRWPRTGFLKPSTNEGLADKGIDNGHGGRLDQTFAAGAGTQRARGEEHVYWGSLPATVVQELEKRIEVIKDSMEALDIEELKDHIRDAHTSGSRPTSSYSVQSSLSILSNHSRLDDFTVVVTATIMQALPHISRLNTLLDTWSTRLTVLRQVPGWIKGMEDTQIALRAAWHSIGRIKVGETSVDSDLTRPAFLTMKSILEEKVAELGQRTDAMLDLLEGREDTLPDEWMDRMDGVEDEYQAWIVEAEIIAEGNELKEGREEKGTIFRPTGGDFPGIIDDTKMRSAIAYVAPASDTITGAYHAIALTEDSATFIPVVADGVGQKRNYDTFDGVAGLDKTREAVDSDMTTFREDMGDILENTTKSNIVRSVSADRPLSYVTMDPLPNSDSLRRSPDPLKEPSDKGLRLPDVLEQPTQPRPKSLSGSAHLELSDRSPFQMKHPGLERMGLVRSDGDHTIMPETEDHLEQAEDLESMYFTNTDLHSLSEAKHPTGHRPTPLNLKQGNTTHGRNISSDISHPGSATSGSFSNMSSPEILSASRVEYFGTPTEVKSPFWPSRESVTPHDTISRQSSQRTERATSTFDSDGVSSELISLPSPQSQAPSFLPAPTILESPVSGFLNRTDSGVNKPQFELRRASATSVEVKSIREVRSITVMRSSSYSSTSSSSSTRRRLRSEEALKEHLPSSTFVDPHPVREAKISSKGWLQSSPGVVDDQENYPLMRSQTLRRSISGTHRKPDFLSSSSKIPFKPPGRVLNRSPLNHGRASPKTRRGLDHTRDFDTHGASFDDDTKGATTPLKSTEDQLEERISSILTNIPAQIRLTSGPGIDSVEVQRPRVASGSKKSDVLSPPTRLIRAQSSTPSLTLSPAYFKASPSRPQTEESEIKLYHLHQPGKDVPIKLFVRLVGENGERVMVRVGGGWADLGEYLKEYASHHGRRSIADGRFEVHGLPSTHSSSSVTTLAGVPNGWSSPSSRPGSPEYRPGSSHLSIRKLRLSSESPVHPGNPSTPEISTRRAQNATPGSADTFASSNHRSASPWVEDDKPLGLAGPRSKNTDISPGKQAWVDGMVDQARKGSGEKKRVGVGDFGDLGKMGGTKRVFFRSSKSDQ